MRNFGIKSFALVIMICVAVAICFYSTNVFAGSSQKISDKSNDFKIISPSKNAKFNVDQRIVMEGTHNISSSSLVWIFLKDIFGGYYLQNPPVELLNDGTWEATNIKIGKEIRYIIAVKVNSKGNVAIKSWVKNNRWGKIKQAEIKGLPGYEELSRVKIITPGS